MSAVTLVNRYLKAFYSGDFHTAQDLLADDFHFKGPFVEASNKAAYFSSAARLAPVVKGHKLLRQWQDGNEVCSIYDVNLETPAGKSAVTMTEWHTTENDRLRSSRVIFDTAAFRALMPPR
jgi:predicted SnoaL-like aldol condensation-catalyzing enzyme